MKTLAMWVLSLALAVQTVMLVKVTQQRERAIAGWRHSIESSEAMQKTCEEALKVARMWEAEWRACSSGTHTNL